MPPFRFQRKLNMQSFSLPAADAGDDSDGLGPSVGSRRRGGTITGFQRKLNTRSLPSAAAAARGSDGVVGTTIIGKSREWHNDSLNSIKELDAKSRDFQDFARSPSNRKSFARGGGGGGGGERRTRVYNKSSHECFDEMDENIICILPLIKGGNIQSDVRGNVTSNSSKYERAQQLYFGEREEEEEEEVMEKCVKGGRCCYVEEEDEEEDEDEAMEECVKAAHCRYIEEEQDEMQLDGIQCVKNKEMEEEEDEMMEDWVQAAHRRYIEKEQDEEEDSLVVEAMEKGGRLVRRYSITKEKVPPELHTGTLGRLMQVLYRITHPRTHPSLLLLLLLLHSALCLSLIFHPPTPPAPLPAAPAPLAPDPAPPL